MAFFLNKPFIICYTEGSVSHILTTYDTIKKISEIKNQ